MTIRENALDIILKKVYVCVCVKEEGGEGGGGSSPSGQSTANVTEGFSNYNSVF